MKNKHIITCYIASLLFSLGLLHAQQIQNLGQLQMQMDKPTLSFEEIQRGADAYFMRIRTSADTTMSKDEKRYRRWEYMNHGRSSYPGCPKGGSLAGLANYMAATPSFRICTSGSSPWTFAGQNPTSESWQDIGIITALAVYPANNNIIYAASNTGGLWKTINNGQNWRNVTDVLGFPIHGIDAVAVSPSNPNVVFMGTGPGTSGYTFINKGTGIFKSTDGGDNWIKTTINGPDNENFDYNIRLIKFHPDNHNIVYAGGGRYLYKSINGGATWDTIFSDTTKGNRTFIDLEFNIQSLDTIYASTKVYHNEPSSYKARVFVSADAGNTWTDKTPAQISSAADASICREIMLDVTPADPSAVYMMYKMEEQNQSQYQRQYQYHFYKSTHSIATGWVHVKTFTSYLSLWLTNCHEFEVSNTNASVFYAGGLKMWKSTNSGQSWRATSLRDPDDEALEVGPSASTHCDIRVLRQLPASPEGDVLVMGNDGGIAKTVNSCASWANLNGDGLGITQFYGFASFNTNDNLVGGAQDNGTRYKNAANNTWKRAYNGDGGWMDINPANNNIVYGNCNGTLLKSTDGGSSFDYLNSVTSSTGPWNLWRRSVVDPSNPDYLWWGKDTLRLYHEPTNSWTDKFTPPVSWVINPGGNDTMYLGSISAIQIAPFDSNIIYLAYDGPTYNDTIIKKYRLMKSTDRGANWTDLSPNFGPYTWAYITDMEVDPYNPNRVWASVSGYWPDGGMNRGTRRVMYSADGGVNWTDRSNGLTAFPVMYLAYQNGTDDVIYAGTDVGVYRWNKAAATWECFNQGLPPAYVTKVDIQNGQGKILISTFGRGIWEAHLPPTPDFHVTSSQVWDEHYYRAFNNNVVVDPGVRLVIKGTVVFAQGKRLIIKPGAKVELDGGKLTNDYGHLWKGVDVEGNSNQSQAIMKSLPSKPVYQGMIELKNNAVIENALDGISTMARDDNGNINWQSFGGIIQATDAHFLNNKRDVQFMSYPHEGNPSYFKNCRFEVNRRIRDGREPETRVSLWGVHNVRFLGCSFKYAPDTIDIYGPLQRGDGIVSVDATYIVDGYCLNKNCISRRLSSFEGFTYGIRVNNISSLLAPIINGANFAGNYESGAHFRNVNQLVFNNCKLAVGEKKMSCGLYLDNCKYYNVQNNRFSNPEGYEEAVGIYVYNSEEGAHNIFRNDFTGLNSGIIPIDNNSGKSNTENGLKMNCNRFEKCECDIAMLYGNTAPTVMFLQGNYFRENPLMLVRNVYGAACGNENKWHVEASDKAIRHDSHKGEKYSPLPQPDCSDLVVEIEEFDVEYNYEEHCPNAFGNRLYDITRIIPDREDLQHALVSLEENYVRKYGHLPQGPSLQGKIQEEQQAMEVEIALQKFDLQSLYAEEIAFYLNDSASHTEQAIEAIARSNRAAAAREQLDAYVYMGDYDKAEPLLKELDNTPEMKGFCEFERLLMDLNKNEQKYYALQKEDYLRDRVFAIATDKNHSEASRAQALLTTALGDSFPEVRLLPKPKGKKAQAVPARENEIVWTGETGDNFSLYPNPASAQINFEFKCLPESVASITIFDLMGKTLETLTLKGGELKSYSTAKMPDGTYFVRLFIDNKFIKTHKVVINH